MRRRPPIAKQEPPAPAPNPATREVPVAKPVAARPIDFRSIDDTDFFDVPRFDSDRAEWLEDLAVHGRAPIRLAARMVTAVLAHRGRGRASRPPAPTAAPPPKTVPAKPSVGKAVVATGNRRPLTAKTLQQRRRRAAINAWTSVSLELTPADEAAWVAWDQAAPNTDARVARLGAQLDKGRLRRSR